MTAATVRDSIERALSHELGPNAPGIRFADVIKGANAYQAGTAAHVAGLRASGDTLTIRLTRPVGDPLHRLALPMFSVVPRRTAVIANGLAKPIPSAGPYYVASYTPGQQLVLRRNPHYTGPRPHALDEFVYTFGQSADQAAGLVKAGQADYPLRASLRHFRSFRRRSPRVAASIGRTARTGSASRSASS